MYQFEKGQKLFLLNTLHPMHIDCVVELFCPTVGGFLLRCSQGLRNDLLYSGAIDFINGFLLQITITGLVRIKNLDIDLGVFELNKASSRQYVDKVQIDLELIDTVSNDWLEDGF